ncbi:MULTISPECIES: helix-turn-helix domain-containing protein [unclassified Caballeronia]|uniref:IclR family transcriptional regulator n=1 Tax=unclassified Caballeronia TaxID=2646786 RepID=UPI002027EDE4|nr:MULTISPECIES: helix-turn-helix domain-containing protein [unclassified Caballeronia]
MSSSALRALTLLEIICTAEAPIGVTALANQLGLSVATVFRSLDALERLGYVARFQASTDFVAGDTTKRLRQTGFARFFLRDVALPYMRQIAFATGESVTLTMPVGWYGVTVATVAGTNPIRTAPAVGSIGELSRDLPSKVLLASLDGQDYQRFVAWARKEGVTLKNDLPRELDAIRSNGYGCEAFNFAEGRASIALPIRLSSRALGVLAIEGPVLDSQNQRADDKKIRDWRQIVTSIETRIADQPALFENPYAHIDPDTISLPVTQVR